MEVPALLRNDTRINLHEHEEDHKGNGYEHIKKCREAKSSKVEVKI